MKSKIVALCLLCVCCFIFEIQAQTSLDCATLQKKVNTTLTKSKTLRLKHESRTRQLNFEKDAQGSEHIWVRLEPTLGHYITHSVISVAEKTYYAKSVWHEDTTAIPWSDKLPFDFDDKAWLDSSKAVINTLAKNYSNCSKLKEVTKTGIPFIIYAVEIEKKTFKIWINKKTDKIELIQQIDERGFIYYSFEFDMPFTIVAPPIILPKKSNFGFGAFPPMYNWEEGFDGNEFVYMLVDKMPEFKEGEAELIKFLAQNVIFPKYANLEGTVYIGFIIEKDGSLTNMKVRRGIGGGGNEEAMRVAQLTKDKWEAGSHAGQKVRVFYTVPVKFKLE